MEVTGLAMWNLEVLKQNIRLGGDQISHREKRGSDRIQIVKLRVRTFEYFEIDAER